MGLFLTKKLRCFLELSGNDKLYGGILWIVEVCNPIDTPKSVSREKSVALALFIENMLVK